MAAKGKRILQLLFAELTREPLLLPERYFRRIGREGPQRVVCDYVAGMTDRYAIGEHRRLFDHTPDLR